MTEKLNTDILKIGFIGGSISSAVGKTHFCASQLDGKWKLVAGCFSSDKKQNLLTAMQYNVNENIFCIVCVVRSGSVNKTIAE